MLFQEQNQSKKRKYGAQGNRRDRRSDNDQKGGPARSTSGMSMSRRRHVLQNPRRGGPGILMTCDTGREFKCQREGLEIIHHYFEKYCSRNAKDDANNNDAGRGEEDTKDDEPLSLEEELKQLQAHQSKKTPSDKPQNFGIFETGCRGTVFVLCTVPDSQLIPSIKQDKSNASNAIDSKEPEHKRQKTSAQEKPKQDSDEKSSKGHEDKDCDTTSTTNSSLQAIWDPVSTVRRILKDLQNDTAKDAPGSRFVTRMIPIEATCYASEEEISLTSRALLKRYLSTVSPSAKPKTFAIASKRRLCDKKALSKDTIINAVVKHVTEFFPDAKVDLDQPDITAVVEICKTLVGISIIPRCHGDFGNFNLVEARAGEKS